MEMEEMKQLRQKRREDLNAQEQAELLRCLSIRDRLERKLKTDEIKLELSDDLGPFTLRFRKLSPFELDKFLVLRRELVAASKDPAKTTELAHKIYAKLEEISLDELDAEYWKSGTGFSADVLGSIMLKIEVSNTYPDKKFMEEIGYFRQVIPGPGVL